MVLVDTSVWIFHLKNGNSRLVELLNDDYVACHPFIVGELACGNLRNRTEILLLLQTLPMTIQLEHQEILQFIENNSLMGKGLGYIDVHLIASALSSEVLIWTFDKKLNEVSQKFSLGFR